MSPQLASLINYVSNNFISSLKSTTVLHLTFSRHCICALGSSTVFYYGNANEKLISHFSGKFHHELPHSRIVKNNYLHLSGCCCECKHDWIVCQPL